MPALTDIIERPAWQPISTAPKDGTDVLAYQRWEGGPERILVMRWDEKGCWRTNVHSFVRFDPTHWQPLPSPPIQHASDCAVHNAPALPVGPCDCGAEPPA